MFGSALSVMFWEDQLRLSISSGLWRFVLSCVFVPNNLEWSIRFPARKLCSVSVKVATVLISFTGETDNRVFADTVTCANQRRSCAHMEQSRPKPYPWSLESCGFGDENDFIYKLEDETTLERPIPF